MCTSNGGKWDIYVYYITTWSHVEFPGKLRGNWVKLDEEENLAATAVEIWNMITIHEYWCGCVRMLFRMCVGEGEGGRTDRGREKKRKRKKAIINSHHANNFLSRLVCWLLAPSSSEKNCKPAHQPVHFPPSVIFVAVPERFIRHRVIWE